MGAPCLGEDDQPRKWLPAKTITEMPGSAYAWLATIEKPRDVTPYGRKALEKEASLFASKPAGERHPFLLESTCRLASLVKAGALDEQDVLAELRSAAATNGLVAEGRGGEVDELWATAMTRVGPRDIKDRDYDPSRNGHANSVQSVHSVHDSREWKPITWGKSPTVPPFPLGCFPDPVQRLCESVASSIGCPIDVVAGMILGVASTAIGRSVSLKLKPGYFVNASLWIPVIGPASEEIPGTGAGRQTDP